MVLNGFDLVELLAERKATFAYKARIMVAMIRRSDSTLANLKC